jgi:hypothetical protein
MKRNVRFSTIAILVSVFLTGRASAHEGHSHGNLKVLADDHHAIDNGMKRFARGLGVECTACHIKGKWDIDDRPSKDAARAFFRESVGEPDATKREASLKPLLDALKLPTPKEPKDLWSALAMFKKRDPPSDAAGKP